MSIFSSASKKVVSERLIKGQDYIEVLDGNQVPRNYINLDSPKWCKQEGIMEFEPLKSAKGIAGSFKHENEIRFKTTFDKGTGCTWGIPTEIDAETKEWKHETIIVRGSMVLDLSIKQQAMWAACIKNSTFCEGSPNLVGKPSYKVYDKAKVAENKIKEISFRRQAEDIIFGLNREGMKEVALMIGVNTVANSNPNMLEAEVHRVMNLNPKEFVSSYNDPNRPYVSIFNKAVSLGVITKTAMQEYLYGGQPIGHSKEAAIKYLVDNNNTATVIDLKCKEIDVESNRSLAIVEHTREEIVEEVDEKEFNPADYVAPFGGDKKGDDEEMVNLKARAKAAGVKGTHLTTWTKESLTKKLEEVEQK